MGNEIEADLHYHNYLMMLDITLALPAKRFGSENVRNLKLLHVELFAQGGGRCQVLAVVGGNFKVLCSLKNSARIFVQATYLTLVAAISAYSKTIHAHVTE